MSRAAFRIGAALCLLWFAAWIYATRYAMLDDSLIHLRYAENLVRLHFITYDGVQHTFGTSSPVYVSLLAAILGVWHSIFVPKAVSVVCYALLLALIAVTCIRSRVSRLATLLTICALAVVLCAMAVRWLTDGMETSLVCVSAVVLALLVQRTQKTIPTPTYSVAMFIYGFFLTMLRVELTFLAALASLAIYFTIINRHRLKPITAGLRSCSLFLGSLAGLIALEIIFGSILPDTALAKSGHGLSLRILRDFVQVSASAVLFGTGSLLLYLLTAWLSAQRICKGDGKLEWAAANACFPLIVIGATLRGQALQGIRYLIWASLFSIVWNILTIAENPSPEDSPSTLSHLDRKLLTAMALALLVMLPVDTYFAGRSMLGRAKTFQHMRSEPLERLAGQTILAQDIGFIGYFSQANICDLSGLVNGREAALKTFSERIRVCIAEHPVALFVNPHLFADLTKYPGIQPSDWLACDKVDFTNVSSDDRQFLLVRREDATRFCPSSDIISMPGLDH